MMAKKIFLTILLAFPALANPGLLPLENGNEWIYQNRNSTQEFRISVGLPAVINGNVYHRLTGYAEEPVWARYGDDGDLYFRNEEKDADELLTRFTSLQGWFDAPLRGCAHVGKADDKEAPYAGKPGRYPETVRILYVVHGCADTGISEEVFAANVGMLRRVTVTIAGPQVYELVSAKVGKSAMQTSPEVAFSIAAEWVKRPGREPELKGTIRLANRSGKDLHLMFPSSQKFDAAVIAPDGHQVWKWSSLMMFAQVLTRDHIPDLAERTYEFMIPTDQLPKLKEGETYQLRAWLTNREGGQFAASTRFELNPPD